MVKSPLSNSSLRLPHHYESPTDFLRRLRSEGVQVVNAKLLDISMVENGWQYRYIHLYINWYVYIASSLVLELRKPELGW